MHFLAEGRNDRIQRWIAEQVPRRSQESDTQDVTQESNDSQSSFEGKKEDGVYWQMEDLEREMALTAYAFGRKNWPISASSIDTSILNLGDLKRLSQLVFEEKLVVPDPQPDIEDPSSPTPERVHDKRRDARIVSQPPEYPPTPRIFDLPSPIIHRAAPVPPPIETTPRTSDVPPIAFIFQETSSPVSSSIHFMPATQESLEAFPSTPRSFTSFIRPSLDGQVKFQELFLSPRLVTPKTPATAVKTPNVVLQEAVVSSPMTPYSISMYSDSCLSTPSLSAFPPTPASTFPSKLLRIPFMTKRETETMPSVPEAPPSLPLDTDPSHQNSDKSLPPPPDPTAEPVSQSSLAFLNVQTNSPVSVPSTLAARNVESPVEHQDADVLSDSASDILSTQLSSRFSLFSSKFSISSLDELDQSTMSEIKGKWSSTIGKGSSRSRSRAASVSTNHTGASKKNVFKSSSASHSRAGSRNETRSPAQIQIQGRSHSRTTSKAGSRNGSLAAQDLSVSLSSLSVLSINEDPIKGSTRQPSRTMITHHTRADSVPTPPPPSVPASVGNGSVSESPSHKTRNDKGRTLMSRISLGMGLRRSRSSESSGTRQKTRTAMLSGPDVSEHVYFNNDMSTATPSVLPLLNDTHSTVISSSSSSLHASAPSYSQTTNPHVPSKPPRLTLTTQFGSSKSTPVIRYPLTPKTPASSISSSFLGNIGNMGESTSAEPLPTINWRECLILRGVNRDNKYDEPVIRWCEQLGEVDDILRIRGSGTIVVYFKEEGIMKKNRGVFDPREVNIAGVGIVTINWSRTMLPPEKKPSA